MKKVLIPALAVALVAMTAAPSMAQQRGGFARFLANPMAVLGQESVHKELKLTGDQVSKVESFIEDETAAMRERFADFRDLSQEERVERMAEIRKEQDAGIAKILKPEQVKRLGQVTTQVQAGFAFFSDETSKALSFTEDQKEKLQVIQEDLGLEMREMFQDAGGDFESLGDSIAELRTKTTGKVVGLFTADQKAAWKKLTGETFKGKFELRFPGR